MYLIIQTIPDLAMDVFAFSRFSQNPWRGHWEVAMRVLRYVNGTVGEGLGNSSEEDATLRG